MTKNAVCHLQIGLLGPFCLLIDQREIEQNVWKSKKALTMLKYLASRHGQRVASDTLIELLWPDNEDVDSTSNLHTAVWYVRRTLAITSEDSQLAESPLRYSNGSYWLDLGGGCVDTDLFESHVKASKQLENTNPEMALFHCESALQLYRDDFLCDEPYEDWTIPQRAQYRELLFQVTLRTAQLLISHRANYLEAASICREAVKKDPFREEFYHAGIQALILAQRQVEAMNLYSDYSQLLMGELQLEPNPAIQELILSIKSGPTRERTGQSTTSEQIRGAYTCSRSVLQTLFETEQRRLKQNGNHFAVLIVANTKGLEQNHTLKEAFAILQGALRNSDLICQYAPNLIVLFLPDTDALGSQALLQRLQHLLDSKFGKEATLSYDMLSSEDLGVMRKKWASALSEK